MTDNEGSTSTKSTDSDDDVLTFKFSYMVKEDHGLPLYGCQFNQWLKKEDPLIFATVGHNRATVYESLDDGTIKLCQCYSDPDINENFYTCAWSYDSVTGNPLLAAAGLRGIIRILNIQLMDCICSFIGHGQAINEVKFHPRKSELLLSASKDHSLRLWNIATNVCVAVFTGAEGHRDEVISCDFNMLGSIIISGGMDHSLKIWNLDTAPLADRITKSYQIKRNTQPFKTFEVHFPDFSTRDIHGNYVDCVRWYGEFVLSKSCDNKIICWKPDSTKPQGHKFSIICKFNMDNCKIWFLRFAIDHFQKSMASGNQIGQVFIWDLDTDDPCKINYLTLTHPKCNSVVRQTSFSRDGKVLIYVCDDSTIWRWNKDFD